MQTRTQELMSFFQKHGGLARFSDILEAGFHPDSLGVLEQEGKVEKIARGLYHMINHTPLSHPDLVMASLQAPKGVFCLLSALSFYEATNEIPNFRTPDLGVKFSEGREIIETARYSNSFLKWVARGA